MGEWLRCLSSLGKYRQWIEKHTLTGCTFPHVSQDRRVQELVAGTLNLTGSEGPPHVQDSLEGAAAGMADQHFRILADSSNDFLPRRGLKTAQHCAWVCEFLRQGESEGGSDEATWSFGVVAGSRLSP